MSIAAFAIFVDWEGNPPQGGILHVAAFEDKGLHVTGVWKSAEDFQAFAGDRLAPALAGAGITSEPPAEIFPAGGFVIPGFRTF